MTDFKTIKHFNCSLDFNLTHLLTVGIMISSIAFLKAVKFFFFFFFCFFFFFFFFVFCFFLFLFCFCSFFCC